MPPFFLKCFLLTWSDGVYSFCLTMSILSRKLKGKKKELHQSVCTTAIAKKLYPKRYILVAFLYAEENLHYLTSVLSKLGKCVFIVVFQQRAKNVASS